MRRRCTGSKDYECIDGSCAFSGYSCPSRSNTKCDHYRYDFLCPDGECAKFDAGCLRPCGTRINDEIYQYPCPGYSYCRAGNGHDCPAVCNVPKPYKCADQECVKNEKFCKSCSGFRCYNGDCTYSYMDKCNGRVDCDDGSDESSSTCDPVSITSTTLVSSTIVPIVVILICIVFTVCIIAARRRRLAGSGATRAQRRGRPVITSGVCVSSTQPTNRHQGSANEYARYSSQLPYGQQQHQPGFTQPYPPMPPTQYRGTPNRQDAPNSSPYNNAGSNQPPYGDFYTGPGVVLHPHGAPYLYASPPGPDAPPSYYDVVK